MRQALAFYRATTRMNLFIYYILKLTWQVTNWNENKNMYILQKFTFLFPFLLKDYSQDDKKQTSVVGHSFFAKNCISSK